MPSDAFFSAPVAPEEMHRLLRLIDERLSLRAAIDPDVPDATTEDVDGGIDAITPVPDATINEAASALDQLAAPLFSVQRVGRVARLGRTLLNIPLRIFGRPQQHFNTVVRQQARSWADLLRTSLQLQSMLMRQLAEERRRAQRLTRRHDELATAVESLRRTLAPPPAAQAAPVIVDLDRYRRACETMPAGLRVFLGPNGPDHGWINVDVRSAPGVMVVADPVHLPFPRESLDALVASDRVDGFRRAELAERVLPYWRSLIRPGGELRLVYVEWRQLLDRYVAGGIDAEALHGLAFGDAHTGRATYDTGALIELLRAAGFERCASVGEPRPGELLPRAELVARRPER